MLLLSAEFVRDRYSGSDTGTQDDATSGEFVAAATAKFMGPPQQDSISLFLHFSARARCVAIVLLRFAAVMPRSVSDNIVQRLAHPRCEKSMFVFHLRLEAGQTLPWHR